MQVKVARKSQKFHETLKVFLETSGKKGYSKIVSIVFVYDFLIFNFNQKG